MKTKMKRIRSARRHADITHAASTRPHTLARPASVGLHAQDARPLKHAANDSARPCQGGCGPLWPWRGAAQSGHILAPTLSPTYTYTYTYIHIHIHVHEKQCTAHLVPSNPIQLNPILSLSLSQPGIAPQATSTAHSHSPSHSRLSLTAPPPHRPATRPATPAPDVAC